jgi:F-type H+-transporting ATPase subunit delta
LIERRVVRRYAEALFGAASSAGVVDRVESDLGLVSFTLEASPDLVEAINSPLVTRQTKRDILRDLFADKVHEITISYLNLLVDKRREEAIPLTEQEYVALANEARGIMTAQVVTAVDLTPQEAAAIVEKLTHMTGKRINLENLVDPSVIAGVLVKIGDTVIDGTARGQLARLKDELLS